MKEEYKIVQTNLISFHLDCLRFVFVLIAFRCCMLLEGMAQKELDENMIMRNYSIR